MNKSSLKSKRFNTKDLVISSLFIALVFVVTYTLQFHLPVSINSGGLVHLGNIPLFAIAIVFGKKKGAIAGGFGMGLFDLLSPFAIWAPCTFIVRGLQGYIIGYISNSGGRNGNSMVWNIIAVIISTIWMLVGYFAYNLLLYRNLAGAISGIPGDLIQTILGIVGMFALMPVLKIIKKKYA